MEKLAMEIVIYDGRCCPFLIRMQYIGEARASLKAFVAYLGHRPRDTDLGPLRIVLRRMIMPPPVSFAPS